MHAQQNIKMCKGKLRLAPRILNFRLDAGECSGSRPVCCIPEESVPFTDWLASLVNPIVGPGVLEKRKTPLPPGNRTLIIHPVSLLLY
jgi:hypothetical protein